MSRQQGGLSTFIRDACRRRGVSLGRASKDMGRSRNWLERVVNYDPDTGEGIRRPRVEPCKEIALYFNEDPNLVLRLAGYIVPVASATPMMEEIATVAQLLGPEDQLALLEHARLLKCRADLNVNHRTWPAVTGVNWDQLEPAFAQELAAFVEDEPATGSIWAEALGTLPERTVQLLFLTAKNQVTLRNQLQRDQTVRVLDRLAHEL